MFDFLKTSKQVQAEHDAEMAAKAKECPENQCGEGKCGRCGENECDIGDEDCIEDVYEMLHEAEIFNEVLKEACVQQYDTRIGTMRLLAAFILSKGVQSLKIDKHFIDMAVDEGLIVNLDKDDSGDAIVTVMSQDAEDGDDDEV